MLSVVACSDTISPGSKTLKPSTYLNTKVKRDNSMLRKGNEILTQENQEVTPRLMTSG
jgi:hypothetical protein